MKKILIFIIFLYTFTLNSYAAELKDCSVYNKLNPKYLACKAANVIKETTNYQKNEWSEEKNKLKKKD
tara:strand:- start:701 stop:904 length:204 start_codon:yes stop_codon:yes gene_type:complete